MKIENEFIPYEQALALKELGFDEPCMYAYCITPKHRVEYKGEKYLKTDGNPFGEFFSGKNWNLSYGSNKNKIQCSAPIFSQAFRWFREKYKPEEINFYIHLLDTHSTPKKYLPCYTIRKGVDVIEVKTSDTYEEAELECLKKLISIVK